MSLSVLTQFCLPSLLFLYNANITFVGFIYTQEYMIHLAGFTL